MDQDVPNTTNSNQIRVLIVDDHEMVRSGLGAVLLVYDDVQLVGEASDGAMAVELCDQLQPHVVLMDLVMPGALDGVAATQAIHARWPQIRVVALTSFGDEHLVRGALQAGATSYLLKNISADDLAHAIRSAYCGQAMLSPEATQALIHSPIRSPAAAPELTSREQEVLQLMVQGLNNIQIADRLVISRSTVKYHVSNILSKLGVTSRTEAIATAFQHGLVA